jgi:hypothetical protein
MLTDAQKHSLQKLIDEVGYDGVTDHALDYHRSKMPLTVPLQLRERNGVTVRSLTRFLETANPAAKVYLVDGYKRLTDVSLEVTSYLHGGCKPIVLFDAASDDVCSGD